MADLEKREIHHHYIKYEPSGHNGLGAHFIERMPSSEASELFDKAKGSDHSIEFKDGNGWHFKLKYFNTGSESYYLLTFKY